MIRPSQYGPEYEVVPQAIFWRPLSYFATSLREDEDGLDFFRAASFTIDNEINFDLRKYRGHPDYTVTVYLSFEFGSLQRRDEDRLRESEARILALKIAAQCPNHTATTEYIKQQVPKYIPLSKNDLLPSHTRKREALWQQIVGNVVSHQKTLAGPFKK